MVFACVYVVYSKMRMVPKEIVLVICGIHLYLGKGFCEAATRRSFPCYILQCVGSVVTMSECLHSLFTKLFEVVLLQMLSNAPGN